MPNMTEKNTHYQIDFFDMDFYVLRWSCGLTDHDITVNIIHDFYWHTPKQWSILPNYIK